MGNKSCLSIGSCLPTHCARSRRKHSSSSISCAKVISLDGDLREFPVPSTVSQLLRCMEDDSNGNFVCNSDSLYYDEHISALDVEQNLEANQIYFILPITKLQQRLTASDMASLAVKASAALQQHGRYNTSKPSNNNQIQIRSAYKTARISPVVLLDQPANATDYDDSGSSTTIKSFSAYTNNESTTPPSPGMPRSGSIRRLHKYSSKRVKLAARSFKLRLTTIYEGSVLYF